MKLKKESLSYRIVTFVLMLSVIFSSVTNMFGNVKITNAEPNESHAKDPNGIYYAYDKGERLRAITASTREKASDWNFCIDKGSGTPSFDGSKPTGTFNLVENVDEAELIRQIKRIQVTISGGKRAKDLINPNYTDTQIYDAIKKLLYVYSEAPERIKEDNYVEVNGVDKTDYGLWKVVEDMIYEYTNSAQPTTYSNTQQNNMREKAKQLISKPDLIPSNVDIKIDVFESRVLPKLGVKGIQSMVTATVTRRAVEEPKVEEPNSSLRTTVSVGDKSASENEELTLKYNEVGQAVTVKDTVRYTNLLANTEYVLTGTLKDVTDVNNIKDVKTATKNFTTDESGSGSVELDFTDVTLEQGKNM